MDHGARTSSQWRAAAIRWKCCDVFSMPKINGIRSDWRSGAIPFIFYFSFSPSFSHLISLARRGIVCALRKWKTTNVEWLTLHAASHLYVELRSSTPDAWFICSRWETERCFFCFFFLIILLLSLRAFAYSPHCNGKYKGLQFSLEIYAQTHVRTTHARTPNRKEKIAIYSAGKWKRRISQCIQATETYMGLHLPKI